MACEKIPFTTKDDAVKEMRRMQRTIRRGPLPIRVYFCRPHSAWHITSKPRRKGVNSG